MKHKTATSDSGNGLVMTIAMILISCVIFGAGFMAGRGTSPNQSASAETPQTASSQDSAEQSAQPANVEPASGTAQESPSNPLLGALTQQNKEEQPQNPGDAAQQQAQQMQQQIQAMTQQQQAVIDQQAQQLQQQQQLQQAQEEYRQQQRENVPSPLTESPPTPVSLGGQY